MGLKPDRMRIRNNRLNKLQSNHYGIETVGMTPKTVGAITGCNRTIMGLKPFINATPMNCAQWLQSNHYGIETKQGCSGSKERLKGCNRTIMGLKRRTRTYIPPLGRPGCNRTIMGLKPGAWNVFGFQGFCVAIEPLWDWNCRWLRPLRCPQAARCNRTIMGLKRHPFLTSY